MTATTTREPDREPVPTLPRAAEVRQAVEAVENGLNYLRGLANALARAERAAEAGSLVPAGSSDGNP